MMISAIIRSNNIQNAAILPYFAMEKGLNDIGLYKWYDYFLLSMNRKVKKILIYKVICCKYTIC